MSAWSLAHRLLRNIEVQARVKELQNQYHEKLTHSREQLIQEIDKLAFIDPIEFVGDDGEFLPLHLMSEHARKSVQEISAIAGNGTEEGMKILNAKWGRDRGRYIDMLGKIHNVFERHAGAGSGVIIVQQYCEADAHL
jgi:hypothetical protein